MMESYWPWRNRCEEPRGFRNVQFDDMNPLKPKRVDYINNKLNQITLNKLYC